ncbi:hypothetical protein Y032_0539g3149 [Ancylostoma ceylanicum]|uniref:Uncharacterized protein n=1 Tax=Ancylostoma ceylanicum TaxID=53326 RepID=A0A016WT62_9BILA|nr:hypothetical protein Y032_0539g3149 [Ancylostoma ceylanicum]
MKTLLVVGFFVVCVIAHDSNEKPDSKEKPGEKPVVPPAAAGGGHGMGSVDGRTPQNAFGMRQEGNIKQQESQHGHIKKYGISCRNWIEPADATAVVIADKVLLSAFAKLMDYTQK